MSPLASEPLHTSAGPAPRAPGLFVLSGSEAGGGPLRLRPAPARNLTEAVASAWRTLRWGWRELRLEMTCTGSATLRLEGALHMPCRVPSCWAGARCLGAHTRGQGGGKKTTQLTYGQAAAQPCQSSSSAQAWTFSLEMPLEYIPQGPGEQAWLELMLTRDESATTVIARFECPLTFKSPQNTA